MTSNLQYWICFMASVLFSDRFHVLLTDFIVTLESHHYRDFLPNKVIHASVPCVIAHSHPE